MLLFGFFSFGEIKRKENKEKPILSTRRFGGLKYIKLYYRLLFS